ncbi:unnamed protein product [Rhodiola kirilowii]
MQDIHHIDAGRIFSGGGDGGDRRFRTDHYQIQALKCPRCDSLNTKFCYFNNYNLSQPRHFCKSCRRYWTKGGVLRNVPVGGGCRKSSSKHSASKPSKESTPKPKSKSSSNSSSESSCLSGTRAAAAVPSTSAATPASADAVSSSANRMFGFSDTKYIFPSLRNTNNFSSELMKGTNYRGGFTDIGNFSNLMTSSSSINVPPAASYDSVAKFQMNPQENNQMEMENWQLSEVADAAGVYVDPTVQIDRTENNRSEPLDWQQQERQMFGLASAVDQGYCWSEQQMFGSW